MCVCLSPFLDKRSYKGFHKEVRTYSLIGDQTHIDVLRYFTWILVMSPDVFTLWMKEDFTRRGLTH